MKRMLTTSFLLIGFFSTELFAISFFSNPNFHFESQGWSSSLPAKVVQYEEQSPGYSEKKYYLELPASEQSLATLKSADRDVIVGRNTPLYFYIEAGMSQNCDAVEMTIQIVSTNGILDKKVITLKNNSRWNAISSDYAVYSRTDHEKVGLQIDYKTSNCATGTFDINYAQMGTSLGELRNYNRGTRLRTFSN